VPDAHISDDFYACHCPKKRGLSHGPALTEAKNAFHILLSFVIGYLQQK
jgi:hypothetical protein